MLVLTAFSFGIHALILWLDPAITIWDDILIDTISVVAGAAVFCLLLFSQRPFRVRLFEILERENIASAYHESEARYRDLAESISDIFCAVNRDLCITYWNKATEVRTGIPAQEALGKPAVEVLPILQNSAPLALFRQALKTQQPDRVIERYSFQGTPLVFEISAYPSATGLSVFVRNITDHALAEQRLRESETHFRSLFDNSPIALLEEDFSAARQYLAKLRTEGVADLPQYFTQHPEQLTAVISCFKILDANPAAVDLSGMSTREQYVALIPSQLGIDPGRTLGEVLAIAEGRPVFHELQTGWNFSGKRMDVEVRWVAVPGHEQDLSRVIVSILDVTELKAAESAWRESEAHFRSIFDSSPIPLVEQDFSGAKQYLDSSRGAGVVDFPRYFQEHPEALTEAISRYQILAANPATLEVYGVRSVQEYIDFIQSEFLADPSNLLGEVLAIAEGRSEFQGLERRCTGSGKTIYLIVRWVAVAGHDRDLSRAIISLMNVTELKETESALRASEGRYRALFEYSPISLWEEDFSGIRDYLNTLRASGVQDFGRYFAEHPDEVSKCIALTRVLNVNQATVQLFKAAGKSELLGALKKTIGEDFLESQARSMLAIADGKTQFATEGKSGP